MFAKFESGFERFGKMTFLQGIIITATDRPVRRTETVHEPPVCPKITGKFKFPVSPD